MRIDILDLFWHVAFLAHSILVSAADHGFHFTLSRRGGRFATHEPANLTRLDEAVQEIELRYAKTERFVEGNRLSRRWKSKASGTAVDEDLVTSVGKHGQWFLSLEMSDQHQSVEVDLDMLSPDFYILTTTSQHGSRYNVFADSHIPNDHRVHPLCRHPTDLFHFPPGPGIRAQSVNLAFSLCSPSKSSPYTLLSSGALLGLSQPQKSLSRLSAPPLFSLLVANNVLGTQVWSLTLLTAQSGILTVGSTLAGHIAAATLRTSIELSNFGNPLFTPQHLDALVSSQMASNFPEDVEEQFHWVQTTGARGLWTTLMAGVWVSGSKVLKNQPVLLDVDCPFILGPPLAVRRFYESIGGAQKVFKIDEGGMRVETEFWKIPCLNRANIAWEFRGKMFGAFRGETREEGLFGPAGGGISLGKLEEEGVGSGYCIGIVVESRMGAGLKDEEGRDPWMNSGMKDVWVLGESFFRGLGVVFDSERERVGFRQF